jgi:hypothetical protein
MYALNLPTFEYKLKKADGKVLIFDVIRKKFVVLTPEEWVRQHFVNYVTQHLQYPKSLIKIEGGLTFNQLQKRSDILVFDRDARPWMIIECKAPTLKLSKETLHQAAAYNSKLKAKYLTISNGMISLCSRTDWDENRTVLLESMPAFPA